MKYGRINDIYSHIICSILCVEHDKLFFTFVFDINNSVNGLKKNIFSKRFYFDGLWLFQRERVSRISSLFQIYIYRHKLNVICFREVWPENDCFGSSNMSTEEEFLALRDIFYADLGGEYSFSL